MPKSSYGVVGTKLYGTNTEMNKKPSESYNP